MRDLSFESPLSPASFRQEWNQPRRLDLNTHKKKMAGDYYAMILN
ncbi:protein-export chaperone SecB, partial [Pseudomonas aeruginosa]